MRIVTDRLALRRPARVDIDAVFAIHHDPRACFHNPSDQLHRRAEAEHLFRRWEEHWQRHGFGYWTVEAGDAAGLPPVPHHPVVGFCGIKVVRFRDREVLNLFYRLDPAVWGAGVATEAATAVVSWAGEHLPNWPVLARVRPANTASQRVALRAGLTRNESQDAPGEDGPDWMFTLRWDRTPEAH